MPETLPICAEMEAEIATLEEEEKEIFLADMGLEKSGLDRPHKKSYHLLGLISFLTAGKKRFVHGLLTKAQRHHQVAGKSTRILKEAL